MTKFANDLVESVALARQFDTDLLHAELQPGYTSTQYRDAFHIELDAGEAWLFDYGVVIFWGADETSKATLLATLSPAMQSPFASMEQEKFSFVINPEAISTQMREDQLQLINYDKLERLAASHALAQSSKLRYFEGKAKQVIEENETIPRQLAKSGKTSLSRKELAKLRGVLFSVKSDIMLNFNLFDTPEYFWSYPELEPIYLAVAKYLDITPRIIVLNKKLETIHELLEMLANEQNHKHSALLEWIIIWLIAFEVVMFFVH